METKVADSVDITLSCVSLHAEIEVRSMNASTASPSDKRRVRKD